MAEEENESSRIKSCVACRYFNKVCNPECIYALYFGYDDLEKFERVNHLFDITNVMKIMVEEVPESKRKAFVESLHEDALWRIKEPIYGRHKQYYLQNQLAYEKDKEILDLSVKLYEKDKEILELFVKSFEKVKEIFEKDKEILELCLARRLQQIKDLQQKVSANKRA